MTDEEFVSSHTGLIVPKHVTKRNEGLKVDFDVEVNEIEEEEESMPTLRPMRNLEAKVHANSMKEYKSMKE